jgi:uncharacterized membrane protein
VLIALVVNFTLMSQLSLDLVGLSAWRFIEAHGRAVLIGLVTLVMCWSVATWLRGLEFPPAIILLVGIVVPTVVIGGSLMWRRNLIGPEGKWVAATLHQFLTHKMSRP